MGTVDPAVALGGRDWIDDGRDPGGRNVDDGNGIDGDAAWRDSLNAG